MAFKRDEAYEEQQKCIAWVILSLFLSVVIAYILILIFIPVTNFIVYGFSARGIFGTY